MTLKRILTVNAGSSSVRFALFREGDPIDRISGGKLERLDATSSADEVLARIGEQVAFDAVDGIGHRIVHGGPRLRDPCRIDHSTIAELKQVAPYDPEHLPREISLVEAFAARFPATPQIACFDVTFHKSLPHVAQMLPIPRRYFGRGVRRYGFHGLSCAFLLEELERQAGPDLARGRVILAHMGGGTSLTAVRDGQSMDTTMAFSPTAGVPMGTRSGDIDPGVVAYLMQEEQLEDEHLRHLFNHESGMQGVSETSGDVRDLLAIEKTDPRAAEALEMYCYEIRKRVGGFAAALGGLDGLVFAGGIGEHAPAIRERICANLEFLGIRLDLKANAANDAVISDAEARVSVRVIPTNEERMIARTTLALLSEGHAAQR